MTSRKGIFTNTTVLFLAACFSLIGANPLLAHSYRDRIVQRTWTQTNWVPNLMNACRTSNGGSGYQESEQIASYVEVEYVTMVDDGAGGHVRHSSYRVNELTDSYFTGRTRCN